MIKGKLGLSTQKIKTKEEYENIRKHNFRQIEKENINKDLSHKNIILYDNNLTYEQLKEENQKEIQENNKKYKTKYRNIRKDAAIGQSLVVQATRESLKEEEHIQFLKEVNERLQDYFKDFKIIDSVIHLDETTPHLHFRFCYFDKNKHKYNQKDTQEHCHLDNIEKVLEPVLRKYNINKREKLEEKIRKMEKEDQEIAKQIMKIKNKKDRKNSLNKLLRKYNKTLGGEDYIQPKYLKLLKLENEKELLKLHKNNIKKIFNSNDGILSFDKKKAEMDILKYILKIVKYQVITKNLEEIKQNLQDLKERYEDIKKDKQQLEIEKIKLQDEIKQLKIYKKKYNKLEEEIQNLQQNINDPEFIRKMYEQQVKEQKQQIHSFYSCSPPLKN